MFGSLCYIWPDHLLNHPGCMQVQFLPKTTWHHTTWKRWHTSIWKEIVLHLQCINFRWCSQTWYFDRGLKPFTCKSICFGSPEFTSSSWWMISPNIPCKVTPQEDPIDVPLQLCRWFIALWCLPETRFLSAAFPEERRSQSGKFFEKPSLHRNFDHFPRHTSDNRWLEHVRLTGRKRTANLGMTLTFPFQTLTT